MMNEKISFLDLTKQYRTIKEEILHALEKVCSHTAFSDGQFVREFEKHFADYCNTKCCAGVNSGTSALHLAVLALDIGPGDEVILPANTFIATAWAVSYTGAKPVFIDCTEDTWNIDPDAIAEHIHENTRGIIGVHLYGQPFDVDRVKEIAERHHLFLIEDCAQAHGAKYKGNAVGGLGHIGCFSFYPGKNLGAYGEGGATTTNNSDLDLRIRNLRNHGSKKKYYHDELGYNYRMDGFQGAVLSVKLPHLDSWNRRRQEIAVKYQQGITNPKIRMQHQPDWAESVYHLFVITTEERDELLEHLNAHHIFPGMHYPVPIHLQKAYAHLNYRAGDLPRAEYLSNHCISLPIYPELSDEEVAKVLESVNSF